MDTTVDPKRKKKGSAHGLEKSSRAKLTIDIKNDERFVTMINGEVIMMAEDLVNLPEADYDDPFIQKMIKEDLNQREKKFGRLTTEDVEEIGRTKDEILKKFPNLAPSEAAEKAWKEISSRRGSSI